jgi:hypothetical protein
MASSSDDRTELISELINLLAGPVSNGMRAAGQINQRRIEAQQHLDEMIAEVRRVAQVAQRMVALLDEIEEPIRQAVPQLARAAQFIGSVLDDAPEDAGRQLAAALASVQRLADGMGPLLMLAQGAAGMFGQRPAPSNAATPASTSAASGTPKKQAATKAAGGKKAPAKKAPVKKAPAKKAPAKKVAVKKAPAKKVAGTRR